MKRIIAAMFLFTVISTHAYSEKGGYMLSDQLSDWCLGDAAHQNFCHGYLIGVYDSSNCKMIRMTPTLEELKKVFLKWLIVKGDDRFIGAQLSAKAAFKKEYGCE